jgi:hypothetical protein
VVSLLAQFHVNGLSVGSAALHFVAPSLIFPEPFAEKARILSFLQVSKGGFWLDISVPLAVAELNFQVPEVSNSVFVFAVTVVLFLSQEMLKKARDKDRIKAIFIIFIATKFLTIVDLSPCFQNSASFFP